MLWMVCLFNYADRQAIFSVFPLLKSQMNLSPVQLGVVGSAFMWVYAAAGPLAGLIGDKLPRKTLILGGLAFWSLITLATALSTRYWHLVLFRSLEGLGEAFYFPASMSLISDYHGPATRSRAMALHQSSVYAGTILGGSAAGYFAQFLGWRSGFYVFGASGILLALMLLFLLKEAPRGSAETTPQANEDQFSREHFRAGVPINPTAILLACIFIGANFVAMVFLTWMPSFLHDKFHMTLGAAGLNATAWLQIASVLGVLIGGAWADRLARRWARGRMMTQAVGLLLGVPFIALAGWTRSVPVLVASITAFGLFKGLYDANIWASLYDVVPISRRAFAVGAMNCVGWLGGGLAPVIIGAASTRFGLGSCISATSIIYLALGVVMMIGIAQRDMGVPPMPEARG